MLFVLGLLGLAIEGYALVGRQPNVENVRGLGPLSVAVTVAGIALLTAAVVPLRHRARRSRAASLLATATAVAAIAAAGVLLRHPLTGHAEFRHDPRELEVTRALLWCAAGLLVALSQWPNVVGIAERQPPGSAGWRIGLALLQAALAAARAPLANTALSLAAVLFGVLILEVAVRMMQGAPLLSVRNLVTDRVALLRVHQVNDYDPLLGWVLKEDRRFDPAGTFTTGRYGVRMNGSESVPVPEHAILVSGDSFTAGSEVGNSESWPALLERKLGEPVVNAAVGGWGADQIVLRIEALMPILHPDRVVVSFMFDDMARAGYMTYGGGNKPYFTARDGGLELHNVPVPQFEGRGGEMGPLRGILGYSHLVAFVMERTGHYEWWFSPPYVRVEVDTTQISCLLLERLKAKTDAARVPLYFLLQYGGAHVARLPEEPRQGRQVMACAAAAGIRAIDTWAPLRALFERDPQALRQLYVMSPSDEYGHMSKAGNDLIAALLVEVLRGGSAHAAGGRH